MISSPPLSDFPVTAVQCTSDSVVYFATGNAVWRNRLATSDSSAASSVAAATLPLSKTERCADAPDSTVVTSLAIAHYRLPSSEGATGQRVSDDGDGEELTIVLIAAADRLLAQLAPPSGAHHKSGGHSAAAFSSNCRCVLRAAASRLLRVTMDAARQTVVVLTASNDVFLLHLDRVVVALRSAAATLPLYADLSREVPHTCLRGPPLGVVLAADILVENSDSGEDEAVHPVYRFFAATYSGEVVEWCPFLADTRSSDLHQAKWSVVSRVQAHPRGCAVFSVRVEHTAAPRSVCGETGSRALQRTHLVTCSDDRTVALYERLSPLSSSTPASPVAGSEWVLLWRGGGTAFAKSRIFDAALCSVWSAKKVSPSTSLSSADASACWSCAVQVAAAGEDGCVQVVCVRRTGPLEDLRNDQSGSVSAVTNVAVTPCLVRARQHRGHGAYRVCFCRSADGHMTLVSGGFDGAVFAHTYALTGQDEVSPATGGRPSSLFNTSAAVAERTAVTSSPREAPEILRRRSASKAAQVRVVHVDAAGRLIACTSEVLCVHPQRGDGTSDCDTSPHYWNTPLPNTLSGDAGAGDADVGGSFCSRCCFVSDASCSNGTCGLPTCAESFDVSFSADGRKKAAENGDERKLSISFAVVATTTGVLYAVPYACSGAAFLSDNGSAVRCVHPTQPRTTCATRWSPCAATPALQEHGKITHIACLAVAGAGNGAAETHTLFVATSHVQNAVVLSTLSLSRGASDTISSDGASEQIVSEWRCVSVWGSCPGPFTTALSLLPTNAAAAATVSFWLLVGDRDGCVRGEHHVVTSAASLDVASTKSGLLSTTSVASVVEYVFPESQHVAVAAFCLEETSAPTHVDKEPERTFSTLLETTVLRVAGTGGVLALLCLPTTKAAHETSKKSVPHPARCREPLRLPFDASAVLAISPRVCVTQCGTTVSVFYRIPGRTSWVLVDAYEDIRAPRLLTARIHEEGIATKSGGAAQRRCPCVTLAHCSDGHTVESFMSFPNQPAREPGSVSCVQTALLHGRGLPGKDYNCVAYAPPPLDSLLMGCEDSSLVAVAAPSASPLRPQSLFSRLTAPMNICGAHHSNILAIAVLPPPDETAAAAATAACVDRAVRFVSVGGGAMVNLWSSDATTSPLRLVDWWCGGGSGVNESGVGGGVDALLATALEKDCGGVQSSAVQQQQQPQQQRQSNARFQKRRGKQAAASPSSSSSAALAERIARFLCVAALDSHTFAVGSSDGTLLICRVLDDATQPNARSEVHLEWQGALNAELPKPILSVSATAPATSAAVGAAKAFVVFPLLVAGDTNGVIYVFEATTRRVVAQRRLEQSSVNALSEVHVLPADAPLGDGQQTRHLTWRFAAAHDSGNVHLLHIDLCSSSDAVFLVQLTVLGSASTGVTAGRSVRWPHLSQPIVAVSEERVTYFNAPAEGDGFLAVIAERRVNVRCVSGAAVVAPDAPEGENGDVDCTTHYPHVAIVGQGFEVV